MKTYSVFSSVSLAFNLTVPAGASRFLFLLTFGPLCASTAVSSAGTFETVELEVDGEVRHFNLFTPSSYDPAVPMPLVFGLHGFSVNASTHQLITNMNSVAEDKGVLVAYPQALDNNWFPGGVPGNNIDYLVEVYGMAIANRNVNKEIVALSGISQGANMSLTLVAAEPDLFSSVVSVAGTRFLTSDDELVPPGVPEVPVRTISRLHVHGTSDSFVPIGGGPAPNFPLFSHSVMESVTNWAAGLGFEGEPTVVPIDDRTADGLTSELLTYRGRTYVGLDGKQYTADTHYVRVSGGGHNWPGDWNGWPAGFQPVTTDFSTSEMAIDFILSHPREYVVGDFTRNGVLDGDDVDALVGEIFAGTNESIFDLTADGAVDGADLDQWLADAATFNGFGEAYLHGDSNLDGSVNAADLNELALNWQSSVTGWSLEDFTADGQANAADLNQLALNWQDSIAMTSSATSPVPEPSAILLTAVGILLIWGQPTCRTAVNAYATGCCLTLVCLFAPRTYAEIIHRAPERTVNEENSLCFNLETGDIDSINEIDGTLNYFCLRHDSLFPMGEAFAAFDSCFFPNECTAYQYQDGEAIEETASWAQMGFWLITSDLFYLGLRIDDGNESRFGWAKVSFEREPGPWRPPIATTLHEFAVETEYGARILAGAVPEPSAGALSIIALVTYLRRWVIRI